MRALFFVLLAIATAVHCGIVNSPTIRAPTSNELVGFILQNPTTASISSRYISFGQPFYQGQLNLPSTVPSAILTANVYSTSTTQQDVQVDAKALHADGSVRQATITLLAPTLAAGASVTVMLTKTMRENTAALSITSVPNTVTVSLNVQGGTTYNYDASSLAKTGTADYWLRGDLVAQSRVVKYVTSSMRMLFDVTMFKDNSWCVDVIYSNDIAMSATGGLVTYTTTITPSGGSAQTYSNIANYQYQGFHRLVCSADYSNINVQIDQAQWIKANSIFPLNYTIGVTQTAIDGLITEMAQSGWGTPLAKNGVTPYMPGTGDRGDIGPVPHGTAVWFNSQSLSARKYTLGWGDASHSVTWNYFDQANGRYLNLVDHPKLWIDGRGDPQPTQLDDGASGWTPESAHNPSLAAVPYVMTGSRYYLDLVQSVAAWQIMNIWPDPRAGYRGYDAPDLGLTIPYAQTRAAAWCLRDIEWAAYLSPNGWYANYFTQIMDNNLNYFQDYFIGYMNERFAPQITGFHAMGTGAEGEMSPWMEDHLMTSISLCHFHGYPQTNAILSFMYNYHINSVFFTSGTWNPFNRVAYRDVISSGTEFCKTWDCMQRLTVSGGFGRTSLTSLGGNYAQLARQSFVLFQYVYPTDSKPKAAEQWLYTNNADYTSVADQVAYPKYYIGVFPKVFSTTKGNATIPAPTIAPGTPAPTTPAPATAAPKTPQPLKLTIGVGADGSVDISDLYDQIRGLIDSSVTFKTELSVVVTPEKYVDYDLDSIKTQLASAGYDVTDAALDAPIVGGGTPAPESDNQKKSSDASSNVISCIVILCAAVLTIL